MPVIEVVPHTLTEEDARNVAFALCGSSANFYEAEPMLNERYSKREIIAQINRWAPYTSTEGMQYLFPGMDQGFWESNAQTLQESISYLTSEYLNESTQDYSHSPCQWTFHKSSHYLFVKHIPIAIAMSISRFRSCAGMCREEASGHHLSFRSARLSSPTRSEKQLF